MQHAVPHHMDVYYKNAHIDFLYTKIQAHMEDARTGVVVVVPVLVVLLA